jgi:hypothetical protein
MKKSRTVFALLIAVLLTVKSVLAQSKSHNSKVSEKKIEECGDKVGNFVLCIETEKSEYKLNEPIVLQVSLKNISDRKVQVIRSSRGYSLDVTNADGKFVPYLRNSHSFITRNWISGRNIVEVEPTKKIYKSIVLTDMYNVKNVGSYSITAKQRILQNAPNKIDVEIKSNKIDIRIIQK